MRIFVVEEDVGGETTKKTRRLHARNMRKEERRAGGREVKYGRNKSSAAVIKLHLHPLCCKRSELLKARNFSYPSPLHPVTEEQPRVAFISKTWCKSRRSRSRKVVPGLRAPKYIFQPIMTTILGCVCKAAYGRRGQHPLCEYIRRSRGCN